MKTQMIISSDELAKEIEDQKVVDEEKRQIEGKQKEIAAFQTKYKITVRSGPAGDKDGAAPENKGVLV